MRIGIIEDDLNICNVLEEMLTRAGHTTQTFHTARNFFTKVILEVPTASVEASGTDSITNPNPFDVLLVDLLLPGDMTGMQIIAQMKTLFPVLPIVVVSAVPSQDLAAVKKRYPEIKTLQKPFKMQHLLAMIERDENSL